MLELRNVRKSEWPHLVVLQCTYRKAGQEGLGARTEVTLGRPGLPLTNKPSSTVPELHAAVYTRDVRCNCFRSFARRVEVFLFSSFSCQTVSSTSMAS